MEKKDSIICLDSYEDQKAPKIIPEETWHCHYKQDGRKRPATNVNGDVQGPCFAFRLDILSVLDLVAVSVNIPAGNSWHIQTG